MHLLSQKSLSARKGNDEDKNSSCLSSRIISIEFTFCITHILLRQIRAYYYKLITVRDDRLQLVLILRVSQADGMKKWPGTQ